MAKTWVRILIFCLTLTIVGAAVYGVSQTARRNQGGIAVSLCGVGSAEEMALETYMQLHVEELSVPAGSDDTPIVFAIQPGETAGQIGERLLEAGLIADAELFRRYLQYEGLDAGLEVGTFTLRQTMTIPEIAQALQSGQRPEQTITVREGLRLEEVAVEVAAQTGISEQEFLALVTTGWRTTELARYAFLSSLPAEATLEGFLFPETYRLPEEASAIDVVARMLSTFEERVTMDMQMAAANRGLTVYQAVTLASIVEREAVIDAERPIIAGVYTNRLNNDWLLGADPTVQYGLGYDASTGQWWRTLYFDVLGIESLADIDNPYNTYRYLGLPPSPICSPGLASIQAVAYPADTPYFYFIANCQTNDGSHLFAATEEEHYANYMLCGGGTE